MNSSLGCRVCRDDLTTIIIPCYATSQTSLRKKYRILIALFKIQFASFYTSTTKSACIIVGRVSDGCLLCAVRQKLLAHPFGRNCGASTYKIFQLFGTTVCTARVRQSFERAPKKKKNPRFSCYPGCPTNTCDMQFIFLVQR